MSTSASHMIMRWQPLAHLRNLSAGMRFLYLSGEGADTTEKSRIRFGRVKGATENALLALGKPEVRKIESCTRRRTREIHVAPCVCTWNVV